MFAKRSVTCSSFAVGPGQWEIIVAVHLCSQVANDFLGVAQMSDCASRTRLSADLVIYLVSVGRNLIAQQL